MHEFINTLTRTLGTIEQPSGEHDDAISAARTVLQYAIECLEAQQRKPGHAELFSDEINGLRDMIGNLPAQRYPS